MPRQRSSSSSSEDEADRSAAQSSAKPKGTDKKKATRYQCPADFVSFCHEPCSSTLTKSLKNGNKELWLIKAPASFNPEGARGIKLPLSGLQTVSVPPPVDGARAGSGHHIYSILASTPGTSELRLLTSSNQSSGSVVFGPAFSGLLNICETYGDSSANQMPQVVPATPAPSIPPGLKQRFHPFGSKTPTWVAESEVDAAAVGPSSATLRLGVVKRSKEEAAGQEEEGEQEEQEEGRKKRKKKKKEKRIKTELEEEEVRVKQEPGAEVQDDATTALHCQDDISEEKRKKKKKKRDREREEVEERVEPGAQVKEEVTVKSEPLDSSFGDVVEGSGKKKKKKKKKHKTDDD